MTDASPALPPLVSAERLRTLLADPAVVVADSRITYVDDRAQPDLDAYRAAHLPGAVFLDLHGAFSDSRAHLDFTLPTPEQFEAAAGALGVGEGRHLVVYTQGWQIWATRVWWLFRYFGFDRVSVLDGGLQGWIEEGHPVESGNVEPRPTTFVARPRPELLASLDDVAAISTDGAPGQLVNALPPALFSGEVATHPGIFGRIPRSVNLPWPLAADTRTAVFAPAPELAEAASSVLAPAGGAPVVAYCGGGVSASALVFGLYLAGRDDVQLYDGSLDEWSEDPTRPVQRD
jgi:thiosulfate/3-mercaptopyruvate sulfurtransferase